ncbi:MAG: hypothetical protein PHH00_00880 [Candidatus Nanoarchaeia archaeon]|nr:hypothetical protein [Candidatus Nanoarchaeia archaeon]
MTGYWDAELKKYHGVQKAEGQRVGGFRRVMEQIEEPAPSAESEHPKSYTPSEAEIQHGIDLVRIVMEAGKGKKE